MIDFDDCGFGWHQYDIAAALTPCFDDSALEQYRDALIADYLTTRPLSEDDLKLMPMFFLIRSLALIGWLHQRPEFGTPSGLSRIKARVCGLAAEFQAPC